MPNSDSYAKTNEGSFGDEQAQADFGAWKFVFGM